MRHAKQRFAVRKEPAQPIKTKARTGVQRRRTPASGAVIPRETSPGELAARLERLADVRRSVVARGKALIADPNYPDKKTTSAIARLLAHKWVAR